MTTFLFLVGFLALCFFLVMHWDKMKKRDSENAKKKEVDRLLSLDESENFIKALSHNRIG